MLAVLARFGLWRAALLVALLVAHSASQLGEVDFVQYSRPVTDQTRSSPVALGVPWVMGRVFAECRPLRLDVPDHRLQSPGPLSAAGVSMALFQTLRATGPLYGV